MTTATEALRLPSVESRTVARAVCAVGLLGIGLIHAIEVQGMYAETPYIGVGFAALAAGCVVIAALLVVTDHSLAFLATAGAAAGPFVGYILSRSTGLPGANQDVGNWMEPLGFASLLLEGLVVVLAVIAAAPVAAARRRAAASFS